MTGMFNRKLCPECDGRDTERVHVEWHTDMVEEIRICNDCPSSHTVFYRDPLVIVDDTPNQQ